MIRASHHPLSSKRFFAGKCFRYMIHVLIHLEVPLIDGLCRPAEAPPHHGILRRERFLFHPVQLLLKSTGLCQAAEVLPQLGIGVQDHELEQSEAKDEVEEGGTTKERFKPRGSPGSTRLVQSSMDSVMMSSPEKILRHCRKHTSSFPTTIPRKFAVSAAAAAELKLLLSSTSSGSRCRHHHHHPLHNHNYHQ